MVTLVVLVVLGLVPAALAVIVMLALSRAQARRRDARYRAAFVDFADEIEAACGAPYVDVTADDITQWEDGYWKAHKDDLYVREALARAFLEGEGHRREGHRGRGKAAVGRLRGGRLRCSRVA